MHLPSIQSMTNPFRYAADFDGSREKRIPPARHEDAQADQRLYMLLLSGSFVPRRYFKFKMIVPSHLMI